MEVLKVKVSSMPLFTYLFVSRVSKVMIITRRGRPLSVPMLS